MREYFGGCNGIYERAAGTSISPGAGGGTADRGKPGWSAVWGKWSYCL